MPFCEILGGLQQNHTPSVVPIAGSSETFSSATVLDLCQGVLLVEKGLLVARHRILPQQSSAHVRHAPTTHSFVVFRGRHIIALSLQLPLKESIFGVNFDLGFQLGNLLHQAGHDLFLEHLALVLLQPSKVFVLDLKIGQFLVEGV